MKQASIVQLKFVKARLVLFAIKPAVDYELHGYIITGMYHYKGHIVSGLVQ